MRVLLSRNAFFGVVAVPLVAGLMAALATPAQAAAAGGCIVTGYASTRAAPATVIIGRAARGDHTVTTVDLTSIQVWRVQEGDTLVVQRSAPDPQAHTTIWPVLYNVPLPWPTATASGGHGVSGPWLVSGVPPVLARRVGVAARSASCSGSVVLETKSNPLLTVAGGGGVLLVLLGLLGAAAMIRRLALRRRYRAVAWLGAPVCGLVAGLGEGSWLQQAGTISPMGQRAPLIVLAGLLLGIVAALAGEVRGALRARKRRPGPVRSSVVGAASVVLAGLLAWIGFLPPGPQGLSDQVVSPLAAQRVTMAAWGAVRTAMENGDAARLSGYFSDEALLFVTNQVKVRDDKTMAVNPLKQPLTVTNLYIPHRSAYPVHFLASGVADVGLGQVGQGVRFYMIFDRPRASSPWTASTIVDQPLLAAYPDIARDALGYTPVPTDHQLAHLLLQPDQAANAYVRYLHDGAAGSPPSSTVLAPGRNTTDQVSANAADVHGAKQSQVDVVYDYHSPQVGRVLPLSGGGALALISFQLDYHATAARFRCFNYKSSSPFRPSGQLRTASITYTGAALLVIPPRAPNAQMQVLGLQTVFHDMRSEPCE